MLLLKLLQKLVRTLNSDGTPGQVAAGIALGSALGLTPLINMHNLLVIAAAMVFNVSFPAVTLGWIVFTPVGFLLDPVFDAVGATLLTGATGLVPTWTTFYNTPVVPFSNYNNTVVLGSFLSWLVLGVPIFFAARWGVARYRETVLARLQRLKVFR